MSDLGPITPVLTAAAFVPPGQQRDPLSPRAPAAAADSIQADADASARAVNGGPTSALSAGLVLVIQNIETTGAADVGPTLTFEPVSPVERAVEELTDPATAQTNAAAVSGAAGSAQRSEPGREAEEREGNDERTDGPGRETIPRRQETGPDGLTEEERRVVAELQRVDAEVRRHEQAHASVGGPYAGAPAYQTVRGPDGRLYAVGGEVQIDVSKIPGNPAATIRKLQVVRRAALAPATPSAADRRVASIAQQGIAEARQELREQRLEEQNAAQESRDLSAERQAALQPSENGDGGSIAELQGRINLGIPVLVRSSGPFVNPSQILSVIA